MTPRSTRAGFLVGGAAVAFGALTGTAGAATLPDGDLAYLRMLVSTELLGADFYRTARRAQPYGAHGAHELRLAEANELEHYRTLAALLTDAGQVPATAADIDFAYPKHAFASTGAVTRLAVALESTFLGAYLGAVGGVQTTTLLQPLAQIAASQAQHLTVFSQLLGHSGLSGAFPRALTIDAASNALAGYTS
jgi:hypothetical protein